MHVQTINSGTDCQQKRWMTTKECAKYLKCSEMFLAKDRQTRLHGIPYVKLGYSVRYDLHAIDEYLISKEIR